MFANGLESNVLPKTTLKTEVQKFKLSQFYDESMLFGKVRLNQSISWLCFDVEDNFMQPVSYVFKTTSYPLLLSKWYRTDGVIVSVQMIAVIGVVETSTPERQTSPPFVSSPIQLNQMRELSKKTVKFCQFFLSLEYLMFSNFNALLVKVSSPID